MRSERHSQRDLFEDRRTSSDLRPDLRAKLSALLQALLTEATGKGPRTDPDHPNGKEDGDDQDHA